MNSNSSSVRFGPTGLPIRPNARICKHYARFKECGFAEKCKFDHPPELLQETGWSSQNIKKAEPRDFDDQRQLHILCCNLIYVIDSFGGEMPLALLSTKYQEFFNCDLDYDKTLSLEDFIQIKLGYIFVIVQHSKETGTKHIELKRYQTSRFDSQTLSQKLQIVFYEVLHLFFASGGKILLGRVKSTYRNVFDKELPIGQDVKMNTFLFQNFPGIFETFNQHQSGDRPNLIFLKVNDVFQKSCKQVSEINQSYPDQISKTHKSSGPNENPHKHQDPSDCFSFLTNGRCRHGNNCWYNHPPKSPTPAQDFKNEKTTDDSHQLQRAPPQTHQASNPPKISTSQAAPGHLDDKSTSDIHQPQGLSFKTQRLDQGINYNPSQFYSQPSVVTSTSHHRDEKSLNSCQPRERPFQTQNSNGATNLRPPQPLEVPFQAPMPNMETHSGPDGLPLHSGSQDCPSYNNSSSHPSKGTCKYNHAIKSHSSNSNEDSGNEWEKTSEVSLERDGNNSSGEDSEAQITISMRELEIASVANEKLVSEVQQLKNENATLLGKIAELEKGCANAVVQAQAKQKDNVEKTKQIEALHNENGNLLRQVDELAEAVTNSESELQKERKKLIDLRQEQKLRDEAFTETIRNLKAKADEQEAEIFGSNLFSTVSSMIQQQDDGIESLNGKKLYELEQIFHQGLEKIKETKEKRQQATGTHSVECCICLDERKTVLLQPCNHLCLCESCADNPSFTSTCPMCKGKVDKVTKVFY